MELRKQIKFQIIKQKQEADFYFKKNSIMSSILYKPYFSRTEKSTQAKNIQTSATKQGQIIAHQNIMDPMISNSSTSNHNKLLKYQHQLKLQKMRIKQLYGNLKSFIQPERQNTLSELVLLQENIDQLKFKISQGLKERVKIIREFQSLTNEKRQEEGLIKEVCRKRKEMTVELQNTQKQTDLLPLRVLQLELIIKEKQQKVKESQNAYLNDLNKYESIKSKIKNQNQTKKDLQVDVMTQMAHNSLIHNSQLKDCLSSRLLYHIQLQEAKREKQTKIFFIENQNHQMEDQIKFMEEKLNKMNEEKQKVINQASEEEFTLGSVQMENIELKARLQILQHSLADHYGLAQNKENFIKTNGQFHQSVILAEKQIEEYLQKLLAIKLQSQYLQSRLKETFLIPTK